MTTTRDTSDPAPAGAAAATDARRPAEADRQAGAAILRLREKAGLSRRALGTACGVTAQQVAKYEDGRNRVTLARAQRIAAALGSDVSAILGATDSRPPPDGRTHAQKAAELTLLGRAMDEAMLDHVLAVAKGLAGRS